MEAAVHVIHALDVSIYYVLYDKHWLNNINLESNEYQMAIRWWLGLDTSGRSMCPFCPDTALDPLGHYARHDGGGGGVVTCHNCLQTI